MPVQENDCDREDGYENHTDQIGDGQVFRVLFEVEVFDHIRDGYNDCHNEDQSGGQVHYQLLIFDTSFYRHQEHVGQPEYYS
jgi:hypothetical protein